MILVDASSQKVNIPLIVGRLLQRSKWFICGWYQFVVDSWLSVKQM